MVNEISKDVEKFIAENQSKVQYTLANIHCTSFAERCCCTRKNHFIAVRSGTPPYFRIANWCKMIEQFDITLNIMRPCTLNPYLSEFEAMEGMYSFDDTPMSPVGTETMIHLKLLRWHTWRYYAVKAWYFVPSLKHYRVIKTTNEAGTVCTTDTWKCNHHSIKTLTVTPIDRIIKATKKLATEIQCHNNAPKYELEAIENLRALITENNAPIIHQATE